MRNTKIKKNPNRDYPLSPTPDPNLRDLKRDLKQAEKDSATTSNTYVSFGRPNPPRGSRTGREIVRKIEEKLDAPSKIRQQIEEVKKNKKNKK